ncbi:response regulator NasT [Paenibacillus sp. UNCCL117]|uniref:ANTAR domain-containing response regulator n=1 Tax=unclassified Paenibacillus TaxID=185978 RepID=UPI00087FD822|nr:MULTISPECIES: ANTAR domain-containing protein [unclassified Paenibacillus]SDD23960.1 response regulator NasT [Paenibacillus sp. cl123]SFW41579.1 response regulator NasT [Paenibacillus sp. UNCCL117]
MFQSFVVIQEGHPSASASVPDADEASISSLPQDNTTFSAALNKLRNMGFRLYPAANPEELAFYSSKADAFVLNVRTEHIGYWRAAALAVRRLPVFWWCDRQSFPSHECRLDAEIDGMLGGGMTDLEIHCAIQVGANHFFRRTEWAQEKEQLLSRLEERKRIDQAKHILTKIKGITEAEAYDFLRKQAMNERKRMADVAGSIVSVYQLLHNEEGGRKRRS